MKRTERLYMMLWGAISGLILAVIISQSAFLEILELNVLSWQYSAYNFFTSKDVSKNNIVLVVFDDASQFDSGIVQFSNLYSQQILSKVLTIIESGRPKIVGLDLDLRGAASPELIQLFHKNNNVVLALFGSIDGPVNLPDLSLAINAKACGYNDLKREVNNMVFQLPVSYQRTTGLEGNSFLLPSFSQAILDTYTNQIHKPKEDSSKAIKYIDFQPNAYSAVSFKQLLSSSFNLSTTANLFKDKIVLVGSTLTYRHDSPLCLHIPFFKSSSEPFVQAEAISTLLNNQIIESLPQDKSWSLLIIFGTIAGLFMSILPTFKRVLIFGFGILGILITGQFYFQFHNLVIPIVPLSTLLISTFISGTLIYLAFDLRKRNFELAIARQSLQARAEEEQKRIAEDLHDETLPALSLTARMADQLVQDLDNHPTPIKIRQQLDLAVNEMRRIINNLHPSVLETMGFIPALENLLSTCSKESKLQGEFINRIGKQNPTFSPFVELQLYRIVQEAMHNVQKHAQANYLGLIIQKEGNKIIISIIDNGKGLAWQSIKNDSFKKDSLWNSHGLVNIKQRAQLIGATVQWTKPSQFPSGVELKIEASIQKPSVIT